MTFVRDVIDTALRTLGTHARPDEIGRLEKAVMHTLRPRYAGETVRVYVPRVGTAQRAERARVVRARWNGQNTAELARELGISESWVLRIVKRSAG